MLELTDKIMQACEEILHRMNSNEKGSGLWNSIREADELRGLREGHFAELGRQLERGKIAFSGFDGMVSGVGQLVDEVLRLRSEKPLSREAARLAREYVNINMGCWAEGQAWHTKGTQLLSALNAAEAETKTTAITREEIAAGLRNAFDTKPGINPSPSILVPECYFAEADYVLSLLNGGYQPSVAATCAKKTPDEEQKQYKMGENTGRWNCAVDVFSLMETKCPVIPSWDSALALIKNRASVKAMTLEELAQAYRQSYYWNEPCIPWDRCAEEGKKGWRAYAKSLATALNLPILPPKKTRADLQKEACDAVNAGDWAALMKTAEEIKKGGAG